MIQFKMKTVTGISFILYFLVLHVTAERFINNNEYSKDEKDDKMIAVRGIFTERRMERESRLMNTRGRVGSERLVNNRRIVDSDLRLSNFISNVNNIRRKNENTSEIRRRYDTKRVGKVDSVNTRRLNENNFENFQRRPDIKLAPRVIRDLMSEKNTRSRDNNDAFRTTRVRALEIRTADNVHPKTNKFQITEDRRASRNNLKMHRYIRIGTEFRHMQKNSNVALQNRSDRRRRIDVKRSQYQVTPYTNMPQTIIRERFTSEIKNQRITDNKNSRRNLKYNEESVRSKSIERIQPNRNTDDSRINWNLEISHIKLRHTLQREKIPQGQIIRRQQNSLSLEKRTDTSVQRRNLAVSNKIRFDDATVERRQFSNHEDTVRVINRRTMNKRETFIAIKKQEKVDKTQNRRRILTQNSERVQHTPIRKSTDPQTFDENSNRIYKNYLNPNYAWSSIISTMAAILFIGQIIHSNMNSKRFNSIRNVFILLKEKVY